MKSDGVYNDDVRRKLKGCRMRLGRTLAPSMVLG
jgi:hypothetical protein